MTSTLTDGQLLREFAVSRDQRAFRELVQRHQDMVFSTALRRCGHADAAADVAQNVFLALATKAARLSSRLSVGAWLYKSTLLETARRQRDEARRSQRERRYAEESATLTTPPGDMTIDDPEAHRARQLMPVLDEAMSGLPGADREALVLRFMQGLSLRDTGAAMGTTEEAARKRVSRALEKLSALFRRRGVSVSATLLAAAVFPEAVKAAPAGLTAGWAGVAASAPATGLGGALLLKLAALTKTQVLAASLAAALVPVTWQAQRINRLESEKATLATQLTAASAKPLSLPNVPRPERQALSAETGPGTSPTAAASSGGNRRDNKSDRRAKMEQWRDLQRQQQRDARLAALQEQIGLEDYQLAAIAEATSKAEEALRDLGDGKDAATAQAGTAAILTTRDGTIAAVLDAAQWQNYEAFCADEERGNREVQANRMLGEIQTTLRLTDPQKDQLFALFAADPALLAKPHNTLPVETVNAELNEKMAAIFTEEQWRHWQQRTGVWSQLFGAGDRFPRRGD